MTTKIVIDGASSFLQLFSKKVEQTRRLRRRVSNTQMPVLKERLIYSTLDSHN
jgi:hypothetical protein